jgi:phosphoglycolate phosphatase-like HAD superfamily hydrolase
MHCRVTAERVGSKPQAIGMDTIAVTWGAHTADALAAASPTHVVASPEALTDFA